MRSHSSSHSHSSHRSSMHSSHRSSMHSSHRSSMHSNTHGSHIGSMHKTGIGAGRSPFKRHGISNAHAFSVGRATGVNINGSAMGAHGAALYRMRRTRNMSKSNFTHSRRARSIFKNRYSFINPNHKFSKSRINKTHRRYTAPKYSSAQNDISMRGAEYTTNEMMKYMWIPLLIFVLIFIGIFFTVIPVMITMFRVF